MRKYVFKYSIFGILTLLFSFNLNAQNFTISGTLSDSANGETIIGASIFTEDGNYGTASNVYGYYSLTLPAGDYTIIFDYTGYIVSERQIKLDKNIKLNLELKIEEQAIEVVEITATKNTDNIDACIKK